MASTDRRKNRCPKAGRVASSLALLLLLGTVAFPSEVNDAKTAQGGAPKESAEPSMPELTSEEERKLHELQERRDELFGRMDFSGAAQVQREFTALLESRLGSAHRRTVEAEVSLRELTCYANLPVRERLQVSLALVLCATGEREMQDGRYDRATKCFEAAATALSDVNGIDQSRYAECCANQAWCTYKLGNVKRAKELYSEATELERKIYGADHPQYAWTLHRLGIVQMELGEFDEARHKLGKSIRVFAEGLRAGSKREILGNCYLVVLELRAGRPVLAELAAKEAFQWLTASELPEDPREEVTQLYAIALLLATEHKLYGEAETILKHIVGLEAGPTVPPATIAAYHQAHAYVLTQLGKERYGLWHSLKGARLQNQAKFLGN